MLRDPGIRVRLVGGGVLIALVASAAAGLVIDRRVGMIVRAGTTSVLEGDAAVYAAAIRDEPDEVPDLAARGQPAAIVDPTGVVRRSTLPDAVQSAIPQLIGVDASRDVSVRSDHYIARATPVATSTGVWHVVTARTADSESDVIDQMRLLIVIGLAVVVLGVGIAAWFLTSAALAPVRRLRTSAERLAAGPSRELLPVGRARDDIADLAGTLNGLVEALRDAADRERQLVSDASHELRTPVAILKTQLEVARRDPESAAGMHAGLEKAAHSTERLSRLVTSLLELSRLEAAGTSPSAPGGELAEEVGLAEERAEFRRATGSGAVLRIESDVTPAGERARFAIEPDDLGRLLDNLIGNAFHAIGERAGTVLVTLRIDDELAVHVFDDGGGMPDGFVEHATERFRRAESSPTGAGLGLAIVAATVRRAGGRLELRNRPGEGLTVRVTIPRIDVEP